MCGEMEVQGGFWELWYAFVVVAVFLEELLSISPKAWYGAEMIPQQLECTF